MVGEARQDPHTRMVSSWHIAGRIPPIKAVMRPFPYAIEAERTVDDARALMSEHEIRHLPVHDADVLVGIVSDRDLRGIAADTTVRSVMSVPVHQVDMERPLDEVLLTLAEGRIGSVLVTRRGRVAGIFTTTDACRLLGETLHRLAPPEAGGDDVA